MKNLNLTNTKHVTDNWLSSLLVVLEMVRLSRISIIFCLVKKPTGVKVFVEAKVENLWKVSLSDLDLYKRIVHELGPVFSHYED